MAPTIADFERDYWADDREAVLDSIRQGVWYGPAEQRPSDMPFNMANYAQSVGPATAGNWWSGPYQPGGGNQYLAGGGGQQPFNESALSQAWLSSGGRTLADWQQFVQQHPEMQPYVTGSKGDKLKLPDGRVVDAVIGAGLGGQGAAWNYETPGGGGYGGGGSSFERAPNPTPFVYDAFQAPAAFQYDAWQMPTGITEENDPGFQARLAEGQKALERSAAARGTLLTGGTLKDINRYAQDFASNEFANVVNRSLQQYGTNRGNAFQNYQTNFENALNAYKTNFDTKFQPWKEGYNQAYNSWAGNFNAANQEFQNQLAKENQRFGQLYSTANMGLNATNQQAMYGSGYANNLAQMYSDYGRQMTDLYTGKGNADAAGQVGAGNAYGNMFGNFANMANMASMYGMTGGGQNNDPYGMGNYYNVNGTRLR